MSRHRRKVSLSSALSFLGWRRDESAHQVHCHDEDGGPETVVVRVIRGYVKLESSDLGPIYLEESQVKRLREALKSAVLDLDKLSGDESSAFRIPVQRSRDSGEGRHTDE